MNYQWIEITNARQNNLKNISLKIPRDALTVITGVSGSGKTSLAYDVINREGQTQFFVNLSAQASALLGKLQKPKVDAITGLTPTISIAQRTTQNNPRSTVGTLTEIYDSLRLLFARLGKSEINNLPINRSLFSFNSLQGACPNCQGLGLEDKISVELLLDNPNKTIREGCFRITNPDGYIIYSQVTMDALQEVCLANGFSVDIPWNELTKEQQNVVLNGSDKIKILYGKHTLESRMKWTGIKANPREKEFYKGILPVMNQILQRDRNPNILRFAKTQECSVCNGSRLNPKALSIKILNKTIYQFSELSLQNLKAELHIQKFNRNERAIAEPIIENIHRSIDKLELLGLEYLSLNRSASTLSGGEMQSIRLTNQLHSKLTHLTYIFDEPSIGLHPSVNKNVIYILKQLVSKGNTVIVVEHDAETIRHADWIVEIGPKAGKDGGQLLFSGTSKNFFTGNYQSLSKAYLNGTKKITFNHEGSASTDYFSLHNAGINNLKNLNVNFKKRALNVVTGISGSGKSSLIHQTLSPLIQGNYHLQLNAKGEPFLRNYEFNKLLIVEQSPIGKTARSTPATYTKVFDLMRDLFAKLPESKAKKFTKSSFSFNTIGGRCEHCEGAGTIEIGMHFLGNIESTCPVCLGQRFKPEILNIKYKDHSISDILRLTVDEAIEVFEFETKIQSYLQVLSKIGLGYVQLGQSSNTLSGGEAQRIRLASELVKENSNNQLFIFDEPTTGLHFQDIQNLMNVFSDLIQKGNTIIVIEHNEDLIALADHIIDLGPYSAEKGGQVVFEGCYQDLLNCKTSLTAKALLDSSTKMVENLKSNHHQSIVLKGVKTHNLKNIDAEISYGKHIVIVGKSGSGKSSLAFDTIYTEAQRSFTEHFPSYIQQFSRPQSQSKFESIQGLTPSIALKQNNKILDPRSTIGTLTGISNTLRLLYSRFGKAHCPLCKSLIEKDFCETCHIQLVDTKRASNYSYNQSEGACTTCKGLGEVLSSNLDLLVDKFDLSFSNGAFKNSKLLESYAHIHEKYMATLLAVGRQKGIDFQLPVQELSPEAIQIAMYGCDEEIFEVEWLYKTKTDEGIHHFKGPWIGFSGLLLDEYYRRYNNGKGQELLAYLTYKTCPTCAGQRLKPDLLNVFFNGQSIHDLSMMPFGDLLHFFENIKPIQGTEQVMSILKESLANLVNFKLEYLHLNRKSNSLSGGELQRVLLSSQIKGKLTGLTYVLDEPCTGLHPSDVKNIIENIQKLCLNGQTVISVEHHSEFIQSADEVIELGPKSGNEGGTVIFAGTSQNYLLTKTKIQYPNNIEFPEINLSEKIEIKGASVFNLKRIDLFFYKNTFNVLTGTSGSGKTTLCQQVLLKSFHRATNCKSVKGLQEFTELIWVDRNPIEQSSSSSLATYLGILDDIKALFTPLVKGTNLTPHHFSYNNKSGQCPDCKGQGFVKIKMDFLNDVEMTCDTCNGMRYQSEVLKIQWKEKNISELLSMTVKEANSFFEGQDKITKKLNLLETIGLDYLKIGQNSHEFSGGEAQRLKIVKRLIEAKKDKSLFIFDEASRGLHDSDLKFLLQIFDVLIEKGHTIIAIEHHPAIISKAKHINDLHQGEVVYQGSIEGLKNSKQSLTGKFL